MPKFPVKLSDKLASRKAEDALRRLDKASDLVDFSSNDYLGFAGIPEIQAGAARILQAYKTFHGATGSRLLSGNHAIHEELETYLQSKFNVEGALLFNSGYDANIGFFSSVPQRGDVVLYDQLVHASIRDGIQMGKAKAYKFKHNDLQDLRQVLHRVKKTEPNTAEIYVVTESVFSMDGDIPDLSALATYCTDNKLYLVVDEAHALGVFGKGLVAGTELENAVFARIITFGKAMGCHGAAVLGAKDLKTYLINFARSFMYTTALAPPSAAMVLASFQWLYTKDGLERQNVLRDHIKFFQDTVVQYGLEHVFLPSSSAIQIAVIGGNTKTKAIATAVQQNGFGAKPILAPTVAKGKERIRICLHAFNTKEQLKGIVALMAKVYG
ncbi:aminotransferase class I/II-fold pyridoxal phosphate-dependent enzyme [Croceitalea dokdonensis]|uniref:aminotransferase class I/II-fold pyridoxal phosphate-dependent enzyme n=1 Tax=Croceitalea dokdonensis TaxID=346188 RepID=UPI0006CA5693|nr:aminotransferase class I/II-fold pyridoxal phosphate-dependent enzyme [Croceitalea dokdonensis]